MRGIFAGACWAEGQPAKLAYLGHVLMEKGPCSQTRRWSSNRPSLSRDMWSLSRKGEVPLGGMADEYAQVQRHLEAQGPEDHHRRDRVDATATSPPKCSQGRARIEGGTVSPSAFAVLRFPLECGWLLDWQISRLCALQDTSGVHARLAIEAASSIP